MRLLPAHRLRTLREWFLQLPEEQPPPGAHARGPRDHAPWLGPTETFRETNDLAYYVPPLTRTLLAALGVSGAALHAGSACSEDLTSAPSTPLGSLRGSHARPPGFSSSNLPSGSGRGGSGRCPRGCLLYTSPSPRDS